MAIEGSRAAAEANERAPVLFGSLGDRCCWEAITGGWVPIAETKACEVEGDELEGTLCVEGSKAPPVNVIFPDGETIA